MPPQAPDGGENLKVGLNKAVLIIRSGGLVAYPTESFYGLGVSAWNEKAIKRLFDIKKRQEDHPILLLIPTKSLLNQYVTHIPDIASQIIEEFWPGGLTLIFEANPDLPLLLTSGTGKIGLRLSSHPVATALTQAVGTAITGTSANISGQPACSNAESVRQSLGKSVDFVLDGGETEGDKGSTVMDITTDPPVILREGMVTREQLEAHIK